MNLISILAFGLPVLWFLSRCFACLKHELRKSEQSCASLLFITRPVRQAARKKAEVVEIKKVRKAEMRQRIDKRLADDLSVPQRFRFSLFNRHRYTLKTSCPRA
jgi:hypothetical protein